MYVGNSVHRYGWADIRFQYQPQKNISVCPYSEVTPTCNLISVDAFETIRLATPANPLSNPYINLILQ